MDAIVNAVGFTDPEGEDWMFVEDAPDVYRFKFHFGIHLQKAIFLRSLPDIGTELQAMWRPILGAYASRVVC